jgi:hypothetical protein
MVGKVEDSQIIVKLPVSKVPRCTGSKTKAFGLTYLQSPDTGASGGPPEGTRVVHHGTNKLLVQQNSIPDRETTSPV